jgi:protein-tyrosine phosphatase
VTHVVSLNRPQEEATLSWNRSPNGLIEVLTITAFDHPEEDLLSHFPRVVHFMDSALVDPSSGHRVLVQAMAGDSRSAALIAAYLMFKKGMSAAQALLQVHLNRIKNHPNHGFTSNLEQLRLWQEMGHRIDRNNLKYRRVVLSSLRFKLRFVSPSKFLGQYSKRRAVDESLLFCPQPFSSLFKSLVPNKGVLSLKKEVMCQKCVQYLLVVIHQLIHQLKMDMRQGLTSYSREDSLRDQLPLESMVPSLGRILRRLVNSYKCCLRLRAFQWKQHFE